MKHILTLITAFLLLQFASAQQPSFQVKVQGSGEPILLIPGLSCPSDVWNETIALHDDRFECHALTFAGFAGLPPKPELQSNFLETIRQDLAAYIESIGKPVTVIGHSLGGFTAMNLAIHSPEHIKKIVVVDSYPSMGALFFGTETDLEQAAAMYDMQAKFMLEMEAEPYEKMQRSTLHAMVQDSALAELALTWSLDSDRATTFQAYGELIRADLRDKMDQIQCPSLILQAGKGPDFSPERWDSINQSQYGSNPNLKIERNMDSMHFIMFDTPAWMAQQLADFL